MSSLYSGFTDEQLETEIETLKAAIRANPSEPSIRSVAGEGRRIEFGSRAAALDNTRSLLRQAIAEQNRRAGTAGTAIGVVFP